MPKRQKSAAPAARPHRGEPSAAAPLVAHPPAKNPTLLGVSIVLFGLWFLFLLVAALWG